MKAIKTILAFLVLILIVLVLAKCGRSPSEMGSGVREGQAAPPFKLRDLTGREVSLDQYRGKVVMLDFWATWCGPCRMTMPLLENLQKEYPNRFTLLAINLQEPASEVRDYILKQNFRSEVLLDEEGTVGETYGTESIPMQVVIDKNGIVRHIHVGFNSGTIAKLRSEIDKLQN